MKIEIVPFGKFARDEGIAVRFIEFMPLEEDRVWSPDVVVTLDEIVREMNKFRPLVEVKRGYSETARKYVFDDGIGEIGIIAPVSHPFCGHCSRVRLTSDGKIRTCLFSVFEHDIVAQMRSEQVTHSSLISSARWLIRKKSGITSANRISFQPRGRWCTSADDEPHRRKKADVGAPTPKQPIKAHRPAAHILGVARGRGV